MLVLTRRINESIIIGGNIEITIVQVRGSGEQAVVRLGISAPKQVSVFRKEVYDEVVAANQQSVQPNMPHLPGALNEVRPDSGRLGSDEPDPQSK